MNMIKSLIPNLFYLLGYVLALISSGIASISLLCYTAGTFLHLKFKTKFGAIMKDYAAEIKRLKSILHTAQPDQKSGKPIKIKQNDSNNRLLSIINGGDNEPGSKV